MATKDFLDTQRTPVNLDSEHYIAIVYMDKPRKLKNLN